MDETKRIPEFYSDGILNVHFCAGQVRFDFMTFQPGTDDGNGNLQKQVNHRLIMSPQGFLTWFEAAHTLMAKLEESGVIAKN